MKECGRWETRRIKRGMVFYTADFAGRRLFIDSQASPPVARACGGLSGLNSAWSADGTNYILECEKQGVEMHAPPKRGARI